MIFAVSLAVVVSIGQQPARASAIRGASRCAQPRASHNAAMAAAGNGWTYLYTGGSVPRLRRWTGASWATAANISAPAVTSPALAADLHGTGLILLGITGVGPNQQLHLGMWRWLSGRWTRLHPPVMPTAGFSSLVLSLADDRAHHTVLLSETVVDAAVARNQLWSWDGTAWKLAAADHFGQITGSTVPNAIATGPGGLVYGFQGTMFHAERLVRWNGATLEPVSAAGAPQAVAGITEDPNTGDLVALGADAAWLPDTPFPTYATYRFDGIRWALTPLSSGLQNWFGMQLAPDPKHRDVVLWGGQRSYGFVPSHPKPPAFPATWRLSGGHWGQAQSSCRLHG